MQYMLDLIERAPVNLPCDYFHVLLRDSSLRRRRIGSCGFKGKPDAAGAVEIGWSLLSENRHKGYGTELVAALVSYAFSAPSVTAVIAEAMPQLTPSIRVLVKNGFVLVGEGSDPGSIRFRCPRLPVN